MKLSKLGFIDIETTGLDPFEASVIEIAVVKIDSSTDEVLDTFEAVVKPQRITQLESAEARRAFEINGMGPQDWENASTVSDVAPRLIEILSDCAFAGQNVAFDRQFLAIALNRIGLALPDPKYMIDTAALAWPLYMRGILPSISLNAICKYYGIPIGIEHRAMADVERNIQAYKRLMNKS